MALSIDIAANTRAAQRDVKDLSKSFEDTADALDDLARDSTRAGDKVEDSFRAMTRAAQKADDAVSDVGKAGPANLRKLGDAGEEVSSELKQNLGETFSSFRGDLEDIPQIAQDVFGGLAGSVGALPGAFALAAGAAGIGLLINGFEQVREQEEARKERVAEWAAAYIGGLDQMEGALADFASIEAIYTDPEKYAQAGKNAKLWGVDVSVAVNAMAGDMTALSVVQNNLTQKTAELEAVNIRNAAATGEGRDRLKELEVGLRDGTAAYQQITGEMAEGREIAKSYSDSLLQILGSAASAGEEVDDLGNKVYTLPDGRQIMINAETGQATTDIQKFKGDADGVIDSVNGRDVVIRARATGLDQVRVDLDALTRPRTMTVTAKLNQSFAQSMGWDQ